MLQLLLTCSLLIQNLVKKVAGRLAVTDFLSQDGSSTMKISIAASERDDELDEDCCLSESHRVMASPSLLTPNLSVAKLRNV